MDAWDRNYLSALKLLVWGRVNGSRSITETYTFVFGTCDCGSPAVKTAETSRVFNVGDLQKSFQKAIVSLLLSMRDLPRLPSKLPAHFLSLNVPG